MNGIAKRATKDILFPLVVVVATIYLAREFLVPLALAVLVSFLLAPLINRLEKIGVNRVFAVIISTVAMLLAVAGIGYMVGGQLIDLARKIPDYQTNLQQKITSLKVPKDSAISRASDTLKTITSQIAAPDAAKQTNGQTNDPQAPLAGSKPTPVTVVSQGGPWETFKEVAGPVLSPLGTAALVLLLVIFFLLEREDLRDRLIHLVGRSHLQVTTQALDEAAQRVSRYLLAQFCVNLSYGICVGVALYFIGVPNAILWGLLAAIFRFVPYVGPWLAASLPILLSLAIFPGWTKPAFTFGVFLTLELIAANVLEPWLYGSSTGMSPIAIIAAAAFWTWLWGGIGLLLSTPLTVCIAVLGKYIPSLGFIDVMIGDKPPIAPEDRFYQRLLAADDVEVLEIAEQCGKKNSLQCVFETLVIPTLRLTEEDFHLGSLNDEDRGRVVQEIHELVSDLSEDQAPAFPPAGATPLADSPTVICIPARDLGDEAGCVMLARLLSQTGVSSFVVPAKLLASEMLERVADSPTRQFCISAVPTASTRQATYLCKRLRERFPEARITVGMWGEPAGDERRISRVRLAGADVIFTSLQDAVREIAGTAAERERVPEVSPTEKPEKEPAPAVEKKPK